MSRDFASIPPSTPEPERATLRRLTRRAERARAALLAQMLREQARPEKRGRPGEQRPEGEL